jgi:hypothetical protein
VLQLVNQYAYTLANPVAFWDPEGRDWKLSGFFYGTASTVGGGLIGYAMGGVGGVVIGGPVGAVLGLAVAEAIYQQLNPGQHGPFSLQDVLEIGTPLYVDPPDGSEAGERPGGAEKPAPRGSRSPAPDVNPGGCECGGVPTPGLSGFRFGAWGAGGFSGAVGGGFGGF